MSKHCGTLYITETETKLCTKKDGSAANKKNSFKIDWPLNKKRNTFYLACETNAETTDWINLLNLVSNLNKNEQQIPIKSIIKQQKPTTTTINGPVEMTTPMAYKANSAPNSPSHTRSQKRFYTLNNSTNFSQYDNKSLNENQNLYSKNSQNIRPNFQSQPNLSSENNNQRIYDAFEKPVEDTHTFQQQQQHNNNNSKYLNMMNYSNPLLKAAYTIDDSLTTTKGNNYQQHYKSEQNLSNYSHMQHPQLGRSHDIYASATTASAHKIDDYEQINKNE